MNATFWSVLPPIIAIILALLTKEVYSSLFVGIFIGALMYSNLNLLHATETTFEIMRSKVSDNLSIIFFLIMLGMIVSLITKSGASRAYGEWASKKIKTKRGASFATFILGALIFVDDYFNCLTVGTVMRPITDKQKITRAKLAYIIDATAAPVCIIAPISSWAVAVTSSLPPDANVNGFSLFLKTIPFNFYAIFTLMFLIWICATDIDFFTMKKYNKHVEKSGQIDSSNEDSTLIVGCGTVKDLLIPILFLIMSCVIAMFYSGGGFNGANIIDAFANCSAADSLVLGSFATILFIFFIYVPRKILTFPQFCESFIEGFKAMVPAIFILTLAWTLSGICSEQYLNLRGFVSSYIHADAKIGVLIPAIFFLTSLFIAFATGTSWGTFAILIPIAFTIFEPNMMLTMTISSCLAGAVCGDHISPISDTTILASAGAQCKHLNHVSTQIPYAVTVAIICFISYLIAGITANGWIGLIVGFIILFIFAVFMTIKCKKENNQ